MADEQPIIKAKYVRTIAHAGKTANFIALTGNSEKYYWLTPDMIKTLLEKKVRVFEKLKKSTETDFNKTKNTDTYGVRALGAINGEIELTLNNYNTDNGGIEVPKGDNIVIIPDNEAIRKELYLAIHEDYLNKMGKDIVGVKPSETPPKDPPGPTGSGETMVEEEGEW